MTARGVVRAARLVLGLAMIAVGVLHFVEPLGFVKIVPPWLPWPHALVTVSGAFEIALGAALFVRRTRRLAGIGLVLLYVAVFPANVNMAVNQIQIGASTLPVWALWARLPLQLVLIAIAWWVSRDSRETSAFPDA